MEMEWVKGRYEGERAKSVSAHADSGLGYVILERGRDGMQQYVMAASRRAVDSPIPPHLLPLTGFEIKKCEAIMEKRNPNRNKK